MASYKVPIEHILIPPIRKACEQYATEIDGGRDPSSDAYIIAFRPRVRAYVSLTRAQLEDEHYNKLIDGVRTRMEQVQAACEDAINSVFDKEPPERQTTIEFSLGSGPT